jgi:hypothetical protein
MLAKLKSLRFIRVYSTHRKMKGYICIFTES